MIETTRLELPELLSPEAASCDYCLSRLEEQLRAAEGVDGVEVNRVQRVAILQFDPDRVSRERLTEEARRTGERLGVSYAHRILPVEGMDCADCARTLERAVQGLPGVQAAEVNFVGARLAIEYAPSEIGLEAVARRAAELGYHIPTPGTAATPRHFLSQRANQYTLGGLILTLGGAAASLSGVPYLPTACYALAALAAGLPVARKGLAGLRASRQIDINALMVIAVVGAAALGDWLEAATVVVLFSLGETLEGYTVERARRSIRSLLDLAPAEAVVRRDGHEERVPVAAIVPGDQIVVRPGERVPADGTVLNGRSAVDQAPITGESVPVDKGAGDEVFAGTVNGAGVLEVRADRAASDSTLARIIHLVEEAQAQRAPSQRFVDAFARRYTPAVVVAAAFVALIPSLITGHWSDWLYRALVLLVVACPCALVISTPVTIVAALSTAARSGVLIKGGAFLEAAGRLRALAFDKTGTLTRGVLRVTTVQPFAQLAPARLLELAAAVERYSEHPLGIAIVAEARQRGLAIPAAGGVVAEPGAGIAATVEGRLVRAGTRAFTGERLAPEVEDALVALEAAGQTAVLVTVDGRPAGVIGLADELRPETPAALRAIESAGIGTTVMLTGDRRAVAEAVAAKAGIDQIEPELLPQQKVAAVRRLLERYHRVGMVGDGINDAPALATATVGIAMGAAASHAALETADIALMSDDLRQVAGTIRLSRAARRVILQNIVLALGIKLVFLVLAVSGTATLWEAVFADVGAALLVIANGMRLLRYPMRQG